MGDLHIDLAEEGEIVLVDLVGSLDLAAYDQVRAALVERLRGDRRDVVVDLNALEYLDSTGLRLLVEVAALASRDRRPCVVVAQPEHAVRRVFTVSGADEVLELVDDVDAARLTLRS